MWYVMQVRTGTEENIRCQCQRLISNNVLERCFIPYYQQKKRFQGEWHIQERILFPGYVFLIAQNLECLSESLRKVIGMTRLLGTGEDIIPLSQEEVNLLLKLGKEEQLVAMSTGIIESDQVRILTGPLQGMEGCIRKIDRHKRKSPRFRRNVRKECRHGGRAGNYFKSYTRGVYEWKRKTKQRKY